MAVLSQVVLPRTIVDEDPAVPGSGTDVNADALMPNFVELRDKYNAHTHTEYDAHVAQTTAAHGGIVATTDARLADQRTPTDGSVTTAKLAAAAVTSAKVDTTVATSRSRKVLSGNRLIKAMVDAPAGVGAPTITVDPTAAILSIPTPPFFNALASALRTTNSQTAWMSAAIYGGTLKLNLSIAAVGPWNAHPHDRGCRRHGGYEPNHAWFLACTFRCCQRDP
jgi:hypothetical protein